MPTGKLMGGVLAAFAQFDNNVRSGDGPSVPTKYDSEVDS